RSGGARDRGGPRALVVEVRPEGRDGPADVLHPQVSGRSDRRDSGLHRQPHIRGISEAPPQRIAQVQAALASGYECDPRHAVNASPAARVLSPTLTGTTCMRRQFALFAALALAASAPRVLSAQDSAAVKQ